MKLFILHDVVDLLDILRSRLPVEVKHVCIFVYNPTADGNRIGAFE